jgi:hypothetical protein
MSQRALSFEPTDGWNPRYLAYSTAHGRTVEEQLRHDHEENAPGYMAPFMSWLTAHWSEWRKLRGLPGEMGCGLSLEQVADFDSWLDAREVSA